MSASAVVPTVWLLAMLAAVALGGAPRRPMAIATIFGAGAVALAVGLWLRPLPSWIGIVVGLVAAWRLIGGPSSVADRLMAGVCLGLAAALHMANGVEAWLAIGIAMGVMAVAAWLVAAGAAFRGWALAAAAFFAPVTGLTPDIAAGWRSAEVLNRAAEGAVRPIPDWTLVWVGLALAAGLLRGLWFRR